jgi:hypothetical protein
LSTCSSPGTQRARGGFEVHAGTEHLKCKDITAAHLACKTPKGPSVTVNTQACVPVFVENAAHLGPAACIESQAAEDRLVIGNGDWQAVAVEPLFALALPLP